MKSPIIRYFLLALVILLAALFAPTFTTAQGPYPPIPHTLEERQDCLRCHQTGTAGATIIPDNHAGIRNDVCTICHQPADRAAMPLPIPHTLEGFENCVACHPAEGEGAPAFIPGEVTTPADDYPPIPHKLEDREDCLECHREGDELTPKIPADHEGLTSEACRDCHQPIDMVAQPTPTAVAVVSIPVGPIPTPIVHPQAARGVNVCYDCHSTAQDGNLVEDADRWHRSIHAEREVACADCHGGDPAATTKEEAKAPGTGYVGVPARVDIPALCASCHADVSSMRQYDLPTDQYAKYQESIHGLRLAEGDENVATCSDCHSGHLVLKANDPASSVYPATVPETCAGCHADEVLMEPYHIPTNQFELYKDSVHGHALLDEQNFRAPNCATCHGTHGAAPPGFEEVANVCGSCHSATQDYYLTSVHSSASDKTPKCITCHGRYDVTKPSEALFLGDEDRHCGSCHEPDSRYGQAAQELYNAIDGAAKAYEEAETAIQVARNVGMLVGPMEGRLREANTALITARAAQHTLDLDLVNERTVTAREISEEVAVSAEVAVAESVFRRQAMIIAVAVIALTVVALYLLKRELDRRLEAGEAVDDG